MSNRRQLYLAYGVFILALAANIAFWVHARRLQATWDIVPPAPEMSQAIMAHLGDPQLAYRHYGLVLQNLGDTGGRKTALADYDYDALTQWFYLEDSLDPVSNYVPNLAAFYYGSVMVTEKIKPLVRYLAYVGERAEGRKWRWLAQAVYLARHVQKDPDLALSLAYRLAALPDPAMPVWTRQMPAFILRDRGDKEAAYEIMARILVTGADAMAPEEVLYMRDYICSKLLKTAQAAKDPICTGEVSE